MRKAPEHQHSRGPHVPPSRIRSIRGGLGAGCDCGRQRTKRARGFDRGRATVRRCRNAHRRVIESGLMRGFSHGTRRGGGSSTPWVLCRDGGRCRPSFRSGRWRPWLRTRPRPKKDLKIGLSPSLRLPAHHADPLGFLSRAGLSVQPDEDRRAGPIRDKMLNKAARRKPLSLAHAARDLLGTGSAASRCASPPSRTSRPGHHPAREAQGQARFPGVEGLQVRRAVRLLDAQLPPAYDVAEHGIVRTPTSQIRVVPPPEMWPICARNIDGFLAPPLHQRASTTRWASSTSCPRTSGNGHPAALRRSEAMSREAPNTFAALYRAVLTAARMARDPSTRADRPGDRAAELPQPAGDRDRAGADRQFADGLGNGQNVPGPRRFDPFPGIRWQCGS